MSREAEAEQPGVVKVVYVVHSEGLSSVFESQVLRPLAKQAVAIQTRLLLSEPIGLFVRRKYQQRRRERYERSRTLGVSLSVVPAPPTRAQWLWPGNCLVCQWFRARFRRDEPIVIHARGSRAAQLGLEVRREFPRARVIYDCRGAEVAELEAQLRIADTGTRRRARLLARAQKGESQASSGADHVLCVSRPLANYLTAQHGVAAGRVTVAPCCVETRLFEEAAENRDAMRQSLGLSEKFVVAYNGSMQWYQRPEESARVFALIKSFRQDAHYLVLTPNADSMRRVCRAAGLGDADMTIVSVNSAAVPQTLVAADVGLLLRESTFVNRVASPVKFGEYLASGVPVIVSEGIGDASDLVARNGVGLVTRGWDGSGGWSQHDALKQFVAEYWNDPPVVRRRCQASARRHLDLDLQARRMGDLYRQVSGVKSASVAPGWDSGGAPNVGQEEIA